MWPLALNPQVQACSAESGHARQNVSIGDSFFPPFELTPYPQSACVRFPQANALFSAPLRAGSTPADEAARRDYHAVVVEGGGGEFLIAGLMDGANGALPPARILDIAKALHEGAPARA